MEEEGLPSFDTRLMAMASPMALPVPSTDDCCDTGFCRRDSGLEYGLYLRCPRAGRAPQMAAQPAGSSLILITVGRMVGPARMSGWRPGKLVALNL